MYIIVWMIPSSPVAFPILVQISHVHAPSDTCAFRVSTNFNVSAQFSSYPITCTSVLSSDTFTNIGKRRIWTKDAGHLPMLINPARSSCCCLWTMLTQSAELQCNSKCCLRVNDICSKFHHQVQIRGCHHDRSVNIHESITKIGSMDGVWVSFCSIQ